MSYYVNILVTLSKSLNFLALHLLFHMTKNMSPAPFPSDSYSNNQVEG